MICNQLASLIIKLLLLRKDLYADSVPVNDACSLDITVGMIDMMEIWEPYFERCHENVL